MFTFVGDHKVNSAIFQIISWVKTLVLCLLNVIVSIAYLPLKMCDKEI
jgi:hypothetical protein